MADPGPHLSNEPLWPAALPVLRDEDFVPVHPNYLKVSLAALAIFAAVVVIATIVIVALVSSSRWIPAAVGGGVLVLTALAAVARTLEVRHTAYLIRERDVSYRRGVFVRSISTVPYVRVQHARIRRGPVERRFGLATLEVNSAGPDLRIQGLDNDEAERLKALVVERAGDLLEDD